jgi:hypothetical protein
MAYRFDATQNIRLTGGTIATHPTEYSFSAWVKTVDTTNRSIFVRSNGDPPSAWSHQLIVSSTAIHYCFDGGSKQTSGGTVPLGVWTHLCGTALNNDFLRLYVNGILVGTPTAVGTLWAGGNDFWVARGSGFPASAFSGDMAEACIWYKQLTAQEVLRVATSRTRYLPLQVHPKSVVLYLPMNDRYEKGAPAIRWKDLNPTTTTTQTLTSAPIGVGDSFATP